MLNQVDVSVNNKFKDFTLGSNEKNYYLAPGALKEYAATKIDNGEIKDKFNNSKQQKHKKSLAFAIGSSALLVGGGVMVLMRGLPKNTEKHLETLKKFLEKKLEKSKWKGSDSLSEFWVYSIRKVENFKKKSQSINNFTTLKDILFKNIMSHTKFTAKIHKGISDYFERLARKTVVSSYTKTAQKFNKMDQSFNKLDQIILRNNPDEIIQYGGKNYTKKELVELAQNYRKNVQNSVTDFISPNALLGRYKNIKDSTSALYSRIWEQAKDGFWSKKNIFGRKEMWQTYMADAQITGNKKTLADKVSVIRNKISYTDKDKTAIISGYLKTIKNLIAPSDREGLNIIKKLEWFLDNPEGLSTNSEQFINTLKTLKNRPIEKGMDEITRQQLKLREKNIDLITELLEGEHKGELQEMLAIYRKIAPYELAQSKAENSLRKAVSSFDKSLKTETIDFFDKVRDLQLGSAPTDILSIIASGGMIGYGLCEASDLDERTSVMLTAGIPILGTIGTTIVCTTKLITGVVSLAIGSAVGAVLKVVGEKLDNHRHSAEQKNHTNG